MAISFGFFLEMAAWIIAGGGTSMKNDILPFINANIGPLILYKWFKPLDYLINIAGLKDLWVEVFVPLPLTCFQK